MVAIVLIGMFNNVVTLRGSPFMVPNRPIPTGLVRRRGRLSRIGRVGRRGRRRAGGPYGLIGGRRHFRPGARAGRRGVHRRRGQLRRDRRMGGRREFRRIGRWGRSLPMRSPMSDVGLTRNLNIPGGRGVLFCRLRFMNCLATALFGPGTPMFVRW